MIYKVIEDKKWEYKTIKISYYDLMHNQLNRICCGEDGWEAYSTEKIDNETFLVFLKRNYLEKKIT